MSRYNQSTKIVFQEDSNDKMLPFSFDLKTSSLKYVSSIDEIMEMKVIMEQSVLMGIDTERKPSIYNKKGEGHILNPTSIIQIAVRNKDHEECVFIIDLQVITADNESCLLLDEVLTKPFTNADCIKIGQGLDRDFRELYDSYPDMKCFIKANSVVETTTFVKQIDCDIVSMVSLKYLVQRFLNCNLIKTQQMSNWELRPLTAQQIHYAACDALVLIRLFDAMNYEMDEIIQTIADDSVIDGGVATFNIKDIYSVIDCSVPLSKKRSHNSLSNNSLSNIVEPDNSTAQTMKQYMKGWTSPSARQWFSEQLTESNSNKKIKHNNNNDSDSPSSSSLNSSDEVDDHFSLPLPKGQGSHMYFLSNNDAIKITRIPSVESIATPPRMDYDSSSDSDVDDIRSVGSFKSIISRNSSISSKKRKSKL